MMKMNGAVYNQVMVYADPVTKQKPEGKAHLGIVCFSLFVSSAILPALRAGVKQCLDLQVKRLSFRLLGLSATWTQHSSSLSLPKRILL